MKTLNTEKRDLLFHGYLNDILDDQGKLELKSYLAECPEAMRRMVKIAHEESQLREELSQVVDENGNMLTESAGTSLESIEAPFPEPLTSVWSRRMWFALAASALVAVGVWWGTRDEGGRMKAEGGEVVARVAGRGQETGFRVQGNGRQALKVGDEIRVGDTIETGKNGEVKLAWVGDPASPGALRRGEGETEVEIGAMSGVRCQVSKKGEKNLFLDKGRLVVTVARQPAGSRFIVTTPQARVEVKGTRFSAATDAAKTRVDVSEGLVRFTQLSGGRAIDVAAGHFAVAAKGVELVATAIQGVDSATDTGVAPPVTPPVQKAPAIVADGQYPTPRTHLDGKVIFEDNFDGPTGNWELVIGKPESGYGPMPMPPGPEKLFWKGKELWDGGLRLDKSFDPKAKTSDVALMIVPYPVQEGQNHRWPFSGVRSVQPIAARRFVVEARAALQEDGSYWFPPIEGPDVAASFRILAVPKNLKSSINDGRLYSWRWELEQLGDEAGKPVFRGREFLDGRFSMSFRICPLTTRLLFSARPKGPCLDRITVKEFGGDPPAEGAP
ncbi:MAG: FecR family protein [Kiritimatiellae bacterium]|nr:FecR family protein [Kiritimatiellia bacterium]